MIQLIQRVDEQPRDEDITLTRKEQAKVTNTLCASGP